MRNRSATALSSSPVLIGSVTLLVAIVAVVLAYNANRGLPFVPTYRVYAEIPSGANLVRGNDVRVGGFRVGSVDSIRPLRKPGAAKRSIAVIGMSLDKNLERLPRDTRVVVRERSAFGLKYVELRPGKSRRGYRAGARLPLANSEARTELDDVLGTFDERTRVGARTALEGFGDALAGRGQSLNAAIQGLVPLTLHLRPVMATLSAPETELDKLFPALERVSAELAPVARQQAQLFADMADTFAALGACGGCLRDTIEKAPPTLAVGTRSLRAQRPFLADLAVLSRTLRPAAYQLRASLPGVRDALRAGRPTLPGTVGLGRDQRQVFSALRTLVRNPSTLGSLRGLGSTLKAGGPLLEYIAPYQTVCNYWNYYWQGIGDHVSATSPGGTYWRTLLGSSTNGRAQDNRVNSFEADRPADVPSNRDPINDTDTSGDALQALHAQPVGPAIDARGRADCEAGQWGYMKGPLLSEPPRYPREPDTASSGTPTNDWYKRAGGSHIVIADNTPGLAGGTYVSRRLGIRSLVDVDQLLKRRGRPDRKVAERP